MFDHALRESDGKCTFATKLQGITSKVFWKQSLGQTEN